MEAGRCCALFKVCAGYPGAGLIDNVLQLCGQIRVPQVSDNPTGWERYFKQSLSPGGRQA